MEKEWFIYKGDHHTGPYHFEDVERMLGEGMVESSDLVWKEGLNDWVPLQILLNDSIEIPPIPEPKEDTRETKTPNILYVDTPPSIRIENHQPPPIPENQVYQEEPLVDVVEEIISEETPELFDKKAPSKKINFIPVVLGLVILFITYKILVAFNSPASERVVIPKLTESDELRLKKLADSDYKGDLPKVEIALDKNLKQIVVSSNYDGEGYFKILLRAKDGKVIGQGPSSLIGDLKLTNKWGSSTELIFQEGVRIYPGYYDVLITGIFWNKVGPLSLYLSQIDAIKKYYNPIKAIDVQYSGQVLFSLEGHSEFNKKLQNYKEELRGIRDYKFEGKIESYRTFKALLAQILFHFEETFKDLRRGYDIYRFENKYSKNVGPIIRSLILDNRKLYMENRDKNPTEAEFYRQFFEAGKKIGENVSEAITEIEKIKLIDEKRRENLRKKYVNSFESIKDDLDKFSEKIKILDQLEAMDGSIFMQGY